MGEEPGERVIADKEPLSLTLSRKRERGYPANPVARMQSGDGVTSFPGLHPGYGHQWICNGGRSSARIGSSSAGPGCRARASVVSLGWP